MTKVSIHSIELTPLEAEVLSEILAAKLDEHLANRAKYMRKDSGAGARTPGNMSHAGSAAARQNQLSIAPHLLDSLRTIVEGLLMCQQPVRFCRLAMELSMAGLFETREAKVYLTDKGMEALR